MHHAAGRAERREGTSERPSAPFPRFAPLPPPPSQAPHITRCRGRGPSYDPPIHHSPPRILPPTRQPAAPLPLPPWPMCDMLSPNVTSTSPSPHPAYPARGLFARPRKHGGGHVVTEGCPCSAPNRVPAAGLSGLFPRDNRGVFVSRATFGRRIPQVLAWRGRCRRPHYSTPVPSSRRDLEKTPGQTGKAPDAPGQGSRQPETRLWRHGRASVSEYTLALLRMLRRCLTMWSSGRRGPEVTVSPDVGTADVPLGGAPESGCAAGAPLMRSLGQGQGQSRFCRWRSSAGPG